MAIVFNAPEDPYGMKGIQQGLGTLGQALMQRSLETRQKQEQKQQRTENASAFQEAMKTASQPGASIQDKLCAFQQYAAMTGDTQSIAPLISDLIKQGSKQQESQNSINFLKSQGIDIPEGAMGDNAPPPAFLASFAKGMKKTYEPESEKLEAQRTASYADTIVKEYQGAEASQNRLNQMKIAAESKQLPTPAMIKTMEFFGVPMGILSNPLAEAYEKNVNEYIKDVSNYFPGQIRVAEIEPYMKTIPTLMNSDGGKELIIDNQSLINQQKINVYDAYKEILKENGGKKPRNLDIEVLERTKQARDDISEKLKENFIKAAKMVEFPTKAVKSGTKLDTSTALTYIKRANGNKKEAEKLAREDGYDF
jgi:hypothetical protein